MDLKNILSDGRVKVVTRFITEFLLKYKYSQQRRHTQKRNSDTNYLP